MGLLGKVIGGAIGAKVLKRLENGARSRPVGGEYIAARDLDAARTYPTPYGSSLLDRCGRFCKENPKLVTTLGSAALAIALASLAKRRRML